MSDYPLTLAEILAMTSKNDDPVKDFYDQIGAPPEEGE